MLLYVNKKKERLRKIKILLTLIGILFLIIANIHHLRQTIHHTSLSLTTYTSIKKLNNWYGNTSPIEIYKTSKKQIKIIIIPSTITKENAPTIAKTILKSQTQTKSPLYITDELNNHIISSLISSLNLETISNLSSNCVIITSNFEKIKPIITNQKLTPFSISKQNFESPTFNTFLETFFPSTKAPSTKLDKEQASLYSFANDHKDIISQILNSSPPSILEQPFSLQNTLLKNIQLCIQTSYQTFCSLDDKSSFIQNISQTLKQIPANEKPQKLILLTSFEKTSPQKLSPSSGLLFRFQARQALLLPHEINSEPFETIKQKSGLNPKHTNNLMQFYQFKTVEIDIK